jgi:hypothetical protein
LTSSQLKFFGTRKPCSERFRDKSIDLGESIKIDELIVVLNLKCLIDKEIKIKKILIKKLNLILEENSKREIKVKNLKTKTKKKKEKNLLVDYIKKFSIDELIVEDSSLDFYPYKIKNAVKLSNIKFKLMDINIDKNLSKKGKFEFYSNIFSKNSFIKSKGELGPIDLASKLLPINGQEEITIVLSELPADIQKQFSKQEIVIQKNSQLNQSASFTGDLNKVINGNGIIKISNIYLGKNPEFRFNINSSINHSFSLNPNQGLLEARVNSNSFKIQNQKQNFGELKFNANIFNNLHNNYLRYSVNGSFSGLEIRDALNCFTKYRNILSGNFAINNFQLSSSGSNPNELASNLKGKALVTIKKGSLYILKSLTRYQNLIDQIFTNAEDFTQKISGEFIDLTTNVEITNKQMYLSNIIINVAPVKINADGYIKELGVVDFKAELFIDKVKTSVPLIIYGTIDKPKIKPDLKKISTTKTNELVDSIIELGIKALTKKKAKSSAPMPAETQSVTSTNSNQETQPTLSKEERRTLMINKLVNLGIQTINEASQKQNKTTNGEQLISKPGN